MAILQSNTAKDIRIEECLDVSDEIGDILDVLLGDSDELGTDAIEQMHRILLETRDRLLGVPEMYDSCSPTDAQAEYPPVIVQLRKRLGIT